MGNMMGDMGSFGWGMSLSGGVFMLLFWGLIIVAIVALVKWLIGQPRQRDASRRNVALEILQERYARGEIEMEEFEQTKRQLQM
jgi:putative membrane protein